MRQGFLEEGGRWRDWSGPLNVNANVVGEGKMYQEHAAMDKTEGWLSANLDNLAALLYGLLTV